MYYVFVCHLIMMLIIETFQDLHKEIVRSQT
jgi:hypothetical protein